ncbi:MAG: ATPase, superfamily [Bacteroidetes bacterium]|nr:ATPase, superfamily [Bacteroidota bacterium]
MAYFKRDIEVELNKWKNDTDRQPLIIRGARQVGKSSLVRQFGKQFRYFIEINLEQDVEVQKIFENSLRPKVICEQLSVFYNTPIVVGETLLFIDEIQNCLPAISVLRYFYEQYQDLHVIAAGSLLEFALSDLPSFGVGRVASMYLYPFSFGEFLSAANENLLRQAIESASPLLPLVDPIHKKALELYKKYILLGGMPKVVSAYMTDTDLLKCQRILDNLIEGYEDDFAKYKKTAVPHIIRQVFKSVSEQNGQKFVYSKAMPDTSHFQIKQALELLTMAGLIVPVTHTSANGIPLGAEVNPKMRKFLIFDSGIFQRLHGLDLSDILLADDFSSVNKGAIAELNVGLDLIKSASPYQRYELYYWHREAKSSNAEVDYIIQKGRDIIPVEVKSGFKGSMQSMFLFMEEKKIMRGIRVSQENFSTVNNIDIYPLYATFKIAR